MKKFFAKKQVMMVALVAALGVAVYLNYYFTNEPTLSAGADSTPSSSDGALGEAYFVNGTVSNISKDETASSTLGEEMNYFDKARNSRSAAREESLRLIQETLGRAEATTEEKKQASEQAATIADRVLQESNIENSILAKGFADCVVFIDKDMATVVVESDELQAAETLQIMELVTGHADLNAKNVQIMASEG